MGESDKKLNRREFLKYSGAGALMLLAGEPLFALLKPTETAGNPLDRYPDRGWEKLYRDLVATDGEFCFLCAPNDTHNCLLKAHTKNGVAMFFGPSYGYGKAKDLYGNQASHRWDPRLCQKGLALVRRIYGDFASAQLGGWTKVLARPRDNLFHLRLNLRYGCLILRYYLDLEAGDYYRALGRYNGSLGQPGYPNAVHAMWRGRWKYDGPTG